MCLDIVLLMSKEVLFEEPAYPIRFIMKLSYSSNYEREGDAGIRSA